MKALRVLGILLLTIASHQAYAWGDDGHKAIALIAQNYLEPAAKTKIDAMLKADAAIKEAAKQFDVQDTKKLIAVPR